jgi:competence CoiA-like predicted nuclease
MLTAESEGFRVSAACAERQKSYFCPSCKNLLVLKRGRIVVAHFAHRPPVLCDWAKGETKAHLEAKQIVFDALSTRGIKAELEFVVQSLPGDRRADVMAWSSKGVPVAIELQHSALSLSILETRARSYANASIAQLWVPFVNKKSLLDFEPRAGGGMFVKRYSARPFERWVHGLNGKEGMWVYLPHERAFRHARLSGHQIYMEESSWFEEGGEERTVGGYYRWSKRYKELTLSAPRSIDQLRIAIRSRKAASLSIYNWPSGLLGYFVPADS